MSEKIRMAIIDDERHITDHVRRIIEERFVGLFEIMVSSDAETVVEALKRYEIPIIISDIRMPKMNGIDFMKYVHENYPSTKFLLLSAYPNFEYVYEANRYGVKYLLKVEDDSVILQTIADMLSTNRRAEDAEGKWDLFCITHRFYHRVLHLPFPGESGCHRISEDDGE